MKRMGVIGLAAAVLLLSSGVGFAADDINVVGGAYTGVLRAPDVGALGKFYQTVTIGDAVTPNQFQKINAQGGAHVNLRDATNAEIGVAAAPLVIKGAGAAAADSVSVRCVNTAGNAFESCASGGADTVGSTVALNALNAAAFVAGAGQKGFEVSIAAGTLAGTVLAEGSLDGGITYPIPGVFRTSAGVSQLSLVLTNPNAATDRGMLFAVPVTHARARVSAHTSGTADAVSRAVANSPASMFVGTDGTSPQTPIVTNSNPGGSDYGIAVRPIGTFTGGTSANDDSAFTVATTPVTPVGFCRQDTPGTITNNRVGCARMNANRDVRITGVDGQGDSIEDDANNARRVTLVTVPEIGGRSGTAAVTSYTNCTLQKELRITSAGTTELLAAAGAGLKHRFCSVHVQFDTEAASNTVKFVRGTTAGCGTPTNITEVWTKSYKDGNGSTEIMDGGATNEKVCATVAGTSPVTIFVRHTNF